MLSGMVYDDAEKLYAEVRRDGNQLLADAWTTLFPESYSLSNAAALSKRGSLVGFNTTHLPRRDVVQIPLGSSAAKLKGQVVQAAQDGSYGYALMDCSEGGQLSVPTGLFADCKPVSGKRISFVTHTSPVLTSRSLHERLQSLRSAQLKCAAHHFRGQDLQSARCRIGVSTSTSRKRVSWSLILFIPSRRELLTPGKTGGLVIFNDRPNYWDAWGMISHRTYPDTAAKSGLDVEIHHLETVQPLEFSNISVVAEGPLRASVRSEFKFRQSTITVTVRMRVRRCVLAMLTLP